MDRNSEGMLSPLSAFEISTNPDFRDSLPIKQITVPKVGDICPQCQSGKIDYDNMLNLSCPYCGFTLAGCFT